MRVGICHGTDCPPRQKTFTYNRLLNVKKKIDCNNTYVKKYTTTLLTF